MDASMHLRCPVCRAIDWYRDGYVIAELESTGAIVKHRVHPSGPTTAESMWSCNKCGHELLVSTQIARDLHALQVAHLPE